MASSKEYLEYILEQLGTLDKISSRPMMGEYIIYYKGKVIGGIYDNRFLLKQTKSSLELMPGAPLELPYDGAKEMLLVENVENIELMNKVISSMYDELPAPKKRK